jgi:hypothetical protein
MPGVGIASNLTLAFGGKGRVQFGDVDVEVGGRQ